MSRLTVRGVALLAAGAVVLAGCGGDGDNDDDSGVTTKETVRIALSSFGNEQLDPTEEAGQVFSNVLLPMYDTILEIADDGSIEAGLAETWEKSDDGTEWTFHLRKGVQFHDGWGELKASDVIFSLNRWMSPDNQSVEGPSLRDVIKSVEAPDDYTLVIETNGVQVALPYYLAPHQAGSGIVFSEKYLTEEGGADFASQSAAMNEKPIGSGPFKFVSRTRGQNLIYEAVENHWRATPAMKRIEFLLVPEASTQVAMLKSGEADIIELASDNVSDIESAGFEAREVKDAQSIGLVFEGTRRPPAANKPTAKVEVREALSYAVDRKTILETVLGGYGSLADSPFDTVSTSAGIDKDHYKEFADKWNTFDPEKAKEMLAAAGYPNGFTGIQMFTYTRPGAGFLPQLGEIIASQWKEIGVETPIVATDYGNYRPHWVNPDPNDPYNAGDANPYNQATRFELSDLLRTYYWSKGTLQLVDDPQLDALIGEISAEPDDDKRMDLMSQAFDIVHANWTMIPLFRVSALYGVNAKEVGEWNAYPGWAFMGRMLESIEK